MTAMSLTNADLLAIKAELTNDPMGLGLTTLEADDEANKNKLNAQNPVNIVLRRSMSTADLFSAIDPIEHQALTPQQARWLDSVLSLQQIDPFRNTAIVDGLRGMFDNAAFESWPVIEAAMRTTSSRVEAMYQAGLLSKSLWLTASDIANARNAV